MKKVIRTVLFGLILSVAGSQNLLADDGVIRIGFNLPLTGMFELVGNNSKNAAELVVKDIEAAGGIEVGGKKYKVEFVFGDNQSSPTTAASLAVNQISVDKVLGIVGGLSSRQAIPIGQMSQAFATPMISPWSTSPITTLDRPYVFRSGIVSTIQGPAITKFAANEFKATKAAVLYDIVSAYPRGMSKNFKEAFEAENGAGSVVAYEEFRTGDEDFSKQLGRIKDSGAEFIFTPQHYNEVPLIVRQAKSMGLNIPIMGSNSWAGGDLIGECGADCNGLFFTGNYAPGNAKGLNKEFVEAYIAAYGQNPDEPAALTWDALLVLVEAIKKTGGLSENLVKDRALVKDSLTNIQNFDGAAGKLSFNETGNPSKCTVVVKIDDNGVFTYHDSVCP
ncbi:MAG: ABC transporter substrate-binding protein [Desulfobulbaceae bacterium]|nr:ABC transporter substrate-binding protein [Desulfobulbaceae bacterium]